MENEEKKEEKKKSTNWGILYLSPPVMMWEGLKGTGLKGKKLWIVWATLWFGIIASVLLYAYFSG